MKRIAAAATLAMAMFMLAGCVSPPSPFDGDRKAADELPAAFADIPINGDTATSRYQGDADGHSLYLMKGTGEYQFCLAYTDGTKDGSGTFCSGGTWIKSTLPDRAEFEVQLNGFVDEPTSGEKQISSWVRQTVGAGGA
jgi:hypothetical protein